MEPTASPDASSALPTPATAPETATPETPAPLSLTEHAKTYLPESEVPEKKGHHSTEQPREKQSGQFKEGRHRAKSQQASPEDVPRIQKLTAEKNENARRLAVAESELAALRAQQAPPAQVAKAETKVEQAAAVEASDQEPTDADFPDDYAKYIEERAAWRARQEVRRLRAEDADAARRADAQKAQEVEVLSWRGRMDDAKAAYPDFLDVVSRPNVIPEGSITDRWIMEDESGAHMLYFLQAHPDERDALLGLPAFQQVKRLALLSQRFVAPPTPQAGTTGSAARPTVSLAPPPPNPVRTVAQRTTPTTTPTDGSLGVLAHAKAYHRDR